MKVFHNRIAQTNNKLQESSNRFRPGSVKQLRAFVDAVIQKKKFILDC